MANYTDIKFTARFGERFEEIKHLFTPEALDECSGAEGRRYREELWAKETHPFFKTEQADSLLSNIRHNGEPAVILTTHTVSINAKIKNYDRVIQQFLDWIAPYLDLTTLVGEYDYEEWHHSGPLYVKDGKILIDESNVYDQRGGDFGLGD